MPTNFLWYSGTASNNGLLITSYNLMTTEMNSLTSGSTAVSSVNGTSGVFNNSTASQGMIGEVFLTLGAIASAVAAGGNIAGWFLVSPDNGTTYENTVSSAALARPPDLIIPVPATTITAGWVYKGAGPVMIPALPYKVWMQNNLGQTMAASGNIIKLSPYAMQY
jgi:hypothetical protein